MQPRDLGRGLLRSCELESKILKGLGLRVQGSLVIYRGLYRGELQGLLRGILGF